jgi:hypothetical protein
MLSDVCCEFCWAVRDSRSRASIVAAAVEFDQAIDHYSHAPFDYGDEIKIVSDAVRAFLAESESDEKLQGLVLAADTVREFLDRPPDSRTN